MMEIDEATVRLAAKKEASAFRRVYDHYAPFIWKVIFRTVNGDREAAREIVQETFIRVYASLGSFSFQSALSTWIYRIAYNTANTYAVKHKKVSSLVNVEDLAEGGKGPDRVYENEELARIALAALTEEERFILTSREVEGLPFHELAAILGRSSESLRTQVSRMKEKLRELFERRFQERSTL
jgi:RNA polymerase sigma-70 factor, ECF subfamily